MGIYLDLSASQNAIGVDMNHCYGRITNLHYHFKTGCLKATLRVFITKEIGVLMRAVESAQKKQIEDIFGSTDMKALAGMVAMEYQMMGNEMYHDTGAMFHPQFIFNDSYIVPVPDVSKLTFDGAYSLIYSAIKEDPRFVNVVDDLEADPLGEAIA